jgi:hypothetical protein
MQATLVSSMSVEMQEVQSRLNRVESDKIGWVVLFRIERSLSLLSQQGQGNEAMSLVAKVVSQEIEARSKN